MVQSRSTIFSLPANQIPALAIESYVLRLETPICRSLRPSLATSLLSGRVPCLLSLHPCRRRRSWRPLSSYAFLRATQFRARPQCVPRDRPISPSNSALPTYFRPCLSAGIHLRCRPWTGSLLWFALPPWTSACSLYLGQAHRMQGSHMPGSECQAF